MTNNKPTTQRRRLFRRLEGELPPLRLTARDIRILDLLYEYRFLTMPQLHAVMRGSKRYLTERLSRLYHHAYVDRPLQQMALRIFGYRYMIYALAHKGAQILSQYYENEKYLRPRWTENNQAVQAPQFLHTLMISQFRVCLTLACQERSNVDLSIWRTPEVSLTQYDMEGRKVWVKPDAYFVLTCRSEGGEHEAHFFLECDRGTMSYPDLRRKLAAYWRMRTERRLVAEWVPHAYRVLTVSPSYERTQRLVEVAKQADTRRRGSILFYFCCEKVYDLDQPERILDPIWQTPADGVLRYLLERKGDGNV